MPRHKKGMTVLVSLCTKVQNIQIIFINYKISDILVTTAYHQVADGTFEVFLAKCIL